MNTLRYNIDTSAANSCIMSMEIPDKMLGWFEDKSYALHREIPQRNGVISIADYGGGSTYSFDLGRAGKSIGREQQLRTAVALIKTAQDTAVIERYACPDPYVTLAPIFGARLRSADSKLPLTVILPRDVLRLADVATAEQAMSRVYTNLLAPHDDGAAKTASQIGLEIDVESGLSLWVGSRRSEMIATKDFDPTADKFILRGEITSHSNQLVLMAGAIALGRRVEQLASS